LKISNESFHLFEKRFVDAAEVGVDLVGDDGVVPYPFRPEDDKNQFGSSFQELLR
jgi:hypothetical protein